MSGSEATDREPTTWFDLLDPATERVVGQVTRDGQVRSDDPDVVERVSRAFDRELLMRDDALAEELGVCFADIASLGPDDAGHHDLVFRNLGVLTGLIPAVSARTDRLS